MTDDRPVRTSNNYIGWLWLAHVLVIGFAFTPFSRGQESPAALSGFESSEVFDVQDDQPWNQYQPIVSRLLYRVCQVSESSLRRFANYNAGIQPADIRTTPRDFRLRVFALRGRVKRIVDIRSDANDAALPFEGLTLSRLITDDQTELLVLTPILRDSTRPPAIPARWPRNTDIDQLVNLHGFFLALVDWGGDADQRAAMGLSNDQAPVLVAPRLAWLPDHSSAAIPVGDSQLLLARHGVDVGRLEALRNSTSPTIGVEDTASFYQLLSASPEISRDELPRESIDFKDCLQNSHQHHGDALTVSGHVRRITRLAIKDDSIQRRYGLDHYFQLDLLVPLDNQRIVIRPPQRALDDQDMIVHENRYPVSVCVAKLPCSPAEMEHRQVFVEGFFFKIWNYESELTQRQNSRLKQRSPLVIGLTPTRVSPPPDYLSLAIGAVGLAMLAGLLWLLWFLDFRQPAAHDRRKSDLPDSIEITDAPLD